MKSMAVLKARCPVVAIGWRCLAPVASSVSRAVRLAGLAALACGLSSFLPREAGIEIVRATWPAVLQGLASVLLVSLLFSLVPLLDVRH